MSKKKSSPKGKKAEMLDNEMIQKPVEKVVAPAQQETVDLNEFRKSAPLSFSKANYRLLFLGLGINILGYILMIGGAAQELDQFDGDALFSDVRITLSPLLIVAGFVVIAYAVMKKPKAQAEVETEV
ncbi:MAG: DUF3098 domain-containing protein [Crocinitomicaceae bacterium]